LYQDKHTPKNQLPIFGAKINDFIGAKFSEKISLKTKKVKNFSWRGI
jgi:hypothetical protein